MCNRVYTFLKQTATLKSVLPPFDYLLCFIFNLSSLVSPVKVGKSQAPLRHPRVWSVKINIYETLLVLFDLDERETPYRSKKQPEWKLFITTISTMYGFDTTRKGGLAMDQTV